MCCSPGKGIHGVGFFTFERHWIKRLDLITEYTKIFVICGSPEVTLPVSQQKTKAMLHATFLQPELSFRFYVNKLFSFYAERCPTKKVRLKARLKSYTVILVRFLSFNESIRAIPVKMKFKCITFGQVLSKVVHRPMHCSRN